MKVYPVIRVSHTIPYVEWPEDIEPTVAKTPAPVPVIEGKEHVLDKVQSHRKRGRENQFLTLMKGYPYHDTLGNPTKDFVNNDGTVPDVWHKCVQGHGILT